MALQDVTNNWTVNGVTETFTYQNGQTVDITYSTTRPYDIAVNPGTGFPDAEHAQLSDYTGQGGNGTENHSAVISYDPPVAETTYQFIGFHAADEAQIYIDGAFANLNVLLATGDITLTSLGGSEGSDLISESTGRLGSDDHSGPYPELVTLTIHKPISSIWVQDMTVTNGFRFDVQLDDDPQFAPCFTTGTLIDTANGPVPVETLQAGDMLRTKDHGFQPVKWVGGSRVMDRTVRIKAGTFGNARDLVVSPRHRMLVQGWQVDLMFNHEEVFATAGAMKNGTTVTQEPEGWVEYFHILLDRHEVIYAEGAETESFFPDEASLNSMAKATREELAQAVDLSTFCRTVRPTLTANQAMYLSHNMDLLEDEQPQVQAAE